MRALWGRLMVFAACFAVTASAQHNAGVAISLMADPLARALRSAPVYVERACQARVNLQALNALAARQPANRPLRVVVMSHLPEGGRRFGTPGRYATALQAALGLKKGVLVMVVGDEVRVATEMVPPQMLAQILRRCASRMVVDPARGVQELEYRLHQAALPPSPLMDPKAWANRPR